MSWGRDDGYDDCGHADEIAHLERELEALQRGAERAEDQLIGELNDAKRRIAELESQLIGLWPPERGAVG